MASKAQNIPSPARTVRLTAGRVERLLSYMVGLAVAGALVFGWLHRQDKTIDPQDGLGYALGIIGGSMMLILLGYPLRKRLRKSGQAMGSVGFWFRFHMMLGLIGPLAVLYHARFSWGALNSAFALGSMVVVASSGLVGRYFYSRVHRGYSGRKLELRALKDEMDGLLALVETRERVGAAILAMLQPYEMRAVAAGATFWSSARAVTTLGVETRRAQRALLRQHPELTDPGAEPLRATIADYFEAVRRAAEFAFYDRLLRLWHLLHLPLFVILVAAAVLHIVAVHMY